MFLRAAICLLFLLLLGPVARAQAPAWQTAVGLGPDNSSGVPSANSYTVQASTADANGNVFLTGSFAGTVNFGGTSLTSSNGEAYVAKYSPATGTFLWALRAGTGSTATVTTSAIAVSGTSVYVTGYFTGTTVIFGSSSLTSGGGDAYVAKLIDAGSSGSFGWVQRAVGTGTNGGNSNGLELAVTGSSIYLLGLINGSSAFGGTTLTAVPGNTSNNGAVTFLAKLTDSGTSGAFRYAGLLNGAPKKVAVNGTSVYVAGVFDGPTVSFGGTTLTNANAQDRDIFITRLIDAGNTASFTGAQRAGGTGRDRVFGLAASATGVVVTGDFGGPATFGSITLSGAGNFGNYEAKWNPTSNAFDWAQQSDYFVSGIGVNGTSLYMAGSFRTGTFGSTVLTSTGGGTASDVFVAKFTDVGTSLGFTWVQLAGGTDDDIANSVSLSGTRVVVQGRFYSPSATFGNITLPRTRSGVSGVSDGFVASLTDPNLTATAPALDVEALGVFPNPAHTNALVQLPVVPGATTATLTLLDALGRAVRTQLVPLKAVGTTAEVPLTGLAPGLYHLRVQAGGQQASRVLIVE